MKEHLLLTGRSQRIYPLTMVTLKVARAEFTDIPAKNVKEYGTGCIYLGLLHFLNPVLVFTLSVCYEVSIRSLCVQLGNFSCTIQTARGHTGEVTLGKIHWGLFWHLGTAKALKLLLVMELSESYKEAVLDSVMAFTIWVNILAIFATQSKGLSIYNTL
jgi:hypothetical protein